MKCSAACDRSSWTLPKGPGFIEYPVFERGYEALKRATRDFRVLGTR